MEFGDGVFIQSLLAFTVGREKMRVENVDHYEDRELRRDRAAVLQMLLDCQQQHLIAEGIVIARTAGGKENRRGPLFLCSAECPQA